MNIDLERADILKYKNLLLLKKIRNEKGRHTELITLYIPANKSLSEVTNKLKYEKTESLNIQDKVNRKNILQTLESIIIKLKKEFTHNLPDTGLVIFANTFEINFIEPAIPNSSSLYKCDSVYHTDQLFDSLLQLDSVYGLITLDNSDAAIGLLIGAKIILLKELDSFIPSKTKKGGQSARRYSEIRKNEAFQFYKEIAQNANNMLMPYCARLKKIIIGGILPAYEHFLNNDVGLFANLKQLLTKAYDVPYVDRNGLKELVRTAKCEINELDYYKEEDIKEYLQSRNEQVIKKEIEIINLLLKGKKLDLIIVTLNYKPKQIYLFTKEDNERIALSEANSENSFTIEDPITYILQNFSNYNFKIAKDSTDLQEYIDYKYNGLVAIL